MTGHIGIAAVLLYLAGIFWTLGYDTIYAHMDRVDDETIGIKSSARKLGDQTRPALIWFYSLASVLIFLALYSAAPSLWALPGMAVIGYLFAYQIRQLDIHDPARCLALFRFNRDQGLIILAIIILCSATA